MEKKTLYIYCRRNVWHWTISFGNLFRDFLCDTYSVAEGTIRSCTAMEKKNLTFIAVATFGNG